MIEKIKVLKSKTKNNDVRVLLEKATSTLNSAMYENIPADARIELENAVIEDLFEKMSSIEDVETQEWLKNSKRNWAVKNLGIREAINTLSSSEAAENLSLAQVLEYFKTLLVNQPEALLYESFISGLQSFHYFPKVGNAVQAIKDRVDTYEADVSITKIMETMKKTKSHYLIPIIEDLVQNYLDNKTEQTKSSLKEGLIKFSYDPFVRDLINLVTADATDLQLEYASAQCDIEKVYSPILYLGENEAIFGVRGSFYVKKGNTLSRLQKEHIDKLDSEFVALCEAINSSNTVIDGKSVTVYEGSDKAVITKDKIIVNEQEFTDEQFSNSANIIEWTGKGHFLGLVEMFKKNFDEIAEVDFAKRVFLKENGDYAADVFRLRGNISVATYNPSMGKGTFYRNVNPIQARNLMMEHLRFDVSKAFEDLLPNEDKINEEIKDTKKAYYDYIQELETKIFEFKLNTNSQDLNKEIINALSEELKEVKDEYKDYLNLIENYMRAPEKDVSEATVELEIDGPLNLTVGGQKFTVPIPQVADKAEGAEAEGEFGEFGSEVGSEDITDSPASAVTFDDMGTELLGDSPSIQGDEVNLGADEIEADADAAEADAEIEMGDEEGEEGAEGGLEEIPGGEGEGDLEGIEGAEGDPEGGEDDEIKIEDESDLELTDETGEEAEKEEEEGEKVEDSAGDAKPKGTKKKVYLKKKKKAE